MPGRETPQATATDPNSGAREPEFEPAHHRFLIELGDGMRATIPAHIVEGVSIPAEDLVFEVRQHTIAETCRSFRLATYNEQLNTGLLEEQLLRSAIRKIGSKTGPDLGDGELDSWLRDIGIQGMKFVNELTGRLNGISKDMSDQYAASYRPDRARRRHAYTVPPITLPRKRWMARTGVDARWFHKLNEDKTVTAHWLVEGEAPDADIQNRLNRDLSFVMTEITVAQENSVADLVENPDDTHACRIISTMLAIVEIGGQALGSTSADMETKLKWLEDIGPRARLLVTGTYAKLHEVDRVELSRFLASAEALE